MILGMTGYGRGQREETGLRVTVEVRSVNHRYSEIQVRLARALAALEPELRRRVGERLGRGRIDVYVHVEHAEGEAYRVELNRSLVEGLQAAARRLHEDMGVEGHLDVATVLRFPEAIATRPADQEPDDRLRRLLHAAVDEALEQVRAMRRREGEVIVADLQPRLERVESLRQSIESRADQVPQEARRRLEQRLAALLPDSAALDPGRLEQEVAALADRADVTEELVRLKGYLEQAGRLLEAPDDEVNGRRLDFLMQEMNREINTIGSKAGDGKVGAAVVEAKQELERIREQVQNLA